MSAATVNHKKNNQPAAAPTTGRGAALCITFGLTMLTLGCGMGLSLIAGGDGYALSLFRRLADGLAGPLSPLLTLLILWGGAKLLVSSRHRVSARNFFMGAGLFWLALAMFTLSAYSRQGTPYLDSLMLQADRSPDFGAQYLSFLRLSYQQGAQGAGGLLGMALAYPLWQALTRVGGLLFCVIALAALLFALFRVTPVELLQRLSALFQKLQQHRPEQQQDQPEQILWQSADDPTGYRQNSSPAQQPAAEAPAPFTPPSWYQPAPIYDTQPAVYPTPDQPREEPGFYPVQPDLYDERFPLHTGNGDQPASGPEDWSDAGELDMPMPDMPAAAEAQPARSPRSQRAKANNKKPMDADPVAAKQQSPKPFSGPAEPPIKQEMGPAASTQELVQETYERPAAVRPAATSSRPTQALDDEDDLPWDVPASSPAPVTPITAAPRSPRANRRENRESKPNQPTQEIRVTQEKKSAAPAPQPAPPADNWSAQVRQRQQEVQQDFPRHTTQQNDPLPVYTDPAVPITGERIPITPKRDRQDPSARMDGTSAPTVRQESADWLVPYQAPPIRLLNEPRPVAQADARQEDERRAQIIEGTLRSFGVESEVKQIMHGPSITQFAIQIAPGVKVNRVANTADNLALELKTQHVRVESPIQGTNYIGIEVPNHLVNTVALREVLESPEMRGNLNPLVVALGKNIAGAPVLCDLSKMPHLLIAGATGSGKSVCINSIVCSLLYRTTPEQVRMIMIDPKQVELSVYNTIPHLLVPVISDPKKAAGALSWVVQEMLERYAKFSAAQVRNLAGYNKLKQGTEDALPNIVVIIDEMADLMEVCRKDVEESIRRLAALARAAGIYMVLATQRPSVDVITGVIKNNIPSRIAFAVSSGTDSRTIIDMIGAEKLMGKGDMLYKPTGSPPTRVQGCFVSDDEVNAIAEYIGSRYQTDFDPNIVDHLESSDRDGAPADDAGSDAAYSGGASGNEAEFSDLLQQAIEMAVEDGQTSTSMLQRRLRVGYARAGRLIDEMEKRNIISQSEGSKPRKTLITREQYYEMTQGE